MNNSFQNFSLDSQKDYFLFMTNSSLLRNICVVFSCICLIVGPLALYSIIWFEKFGSGQKRTLLNMLFSMTCWICIGFAVFVYLPETIRFIYGPFPEIICSANTVLRHSFVSMLLLFMDAISLTRYVFIFKLKNPAAFNDTFWCFFLCLFIIIGSFLVQGSWYIYADYRPISFYMCTGRNPFHEQKRSTTIYGVNEICSATLNIVIYLKIYFYKKSTGSDQFEKQSLTAITSNIISFLIIVLSAIVIKNLDVTNPEDINKYWFQVVTYYRHLILPSIILMCIVLSCLLNKRYIRVVAEKFFTLNV